MLTLYCLHIEYPIILDKVISLCYTPQTILDRIILLLMNTKHIATNLFVSSIIVAALAFTAQPANASGYGSYGCTGDCTTPNDLTINKQVYDPIKKVYVENLGPTDANFTAGTEVQYKLKVTNGSGETMNVTVEDTLPQYMSWIGGDGTYNKGSNKVTMKIDNMIAGTSTELVVLAKVADAKDLPAKSEFCVTNTAKATSPARPNGDDDTAQACIATNVLGVTRLPTAGFTDMAMLVPFAITGIAGLALIKRKK